MKKISEEQLKEIREIVNSIRYVGGKITDFELEKSLAVEAYKQLNQKLEELKGKVFEEFGDVDINLETGEITENKKEE